MQWSADGDYLFCQKGSAISVLSVNKGSVIATLNEIESDQEEDTINCFTLGNNDLNIITHHKSGLFKLWDWKGNNTVPQL